MRIGIDARYALRQRRGIGKYIINLINNLSHLNSNHTFYIYVDHGEIPPDFFPKKENFILTVIKGNYLLWEGIFLPFHLQKDKIDVYHGTSNTSPFFVGKTKIVTTIHDVMFLKKELKPGNLYQQLGFWYRKLNLILTGKKATAIITVSNYSKEDILRESKIDKEKIRVIWESYDIIFKKQNIPAANYQKKYILALGAIDPRKNSLFVVKVFKLLKQKYPDFMLVFCGFQGWKHSSAFQEVQVSNLENDVIFLDYISDEELVSLYKGAELFLYPSSYEGFGIPPLEAMACGCPVITSNITSIPEIVSDSAILIDKFQENTYFEACCKLLENNEIRNELIRKGLLRINLFSWKKMAQETLEVYENI